MKLNNIIKKVLILFFGILILFFGINLTLYLLPSKQVIVNIPSGISAKEIAQILKSNNLIFNVDLFTGISDLFNISNKLKKGTYKFKITSPSFEILYKLYTGKNYKIKITIPEGFTCEQIADILSSKNLVDKYKFIKFVEKNKYEGYLFPETYFFDLGISQQDLIDCMFKQFKISIIKNIKQIKFDKKISIDEMKKIQIILNTKKYTFNDIIILASIVEKEAKLDSERKIIAGIFLNRLKKNWLLESCATVRYASKKYKEKLTYKDLKINSKYNTYKYHGLPPGPICNPGIKSIIAVLEPENTDLMFFFNEKNKETHKFSKYYKEHIKSQKYKK